MQEKELPLKIKRTNKANVQELNVIQRSEKWLELRKKYITATDMPFIKKTLIDNEKYYNYSFEDFAKKKSGELQENNFWNKDKLEKGEITEKEAENTVAGICLYLNNSKQSILKYDYNYGKVFTRNEWALASLDYLITENDKPYAPIEIKYTESEKTFNEYKDGTHINLYQLAFQMYVLQCTRGLILLHYKESKNPIQIKLDSKSPQFKEIIKVIRTLIKLHKTVCVEKNDPCEASINYIKVLADELVKFEQKNKEVEKKLKLKKEELKTLLKRIKELTLEIKNTTKNKISTRLEVNKLIVEADKCKKNYIKHRKVIYDEMKKNKLHKVNCNGYTIYKTCTKNNNCRIIVKE